MKENIPMPFAEQIKQHQKTIIAMIISLVLFFSALFFSKFINVLVPLSGATIMLLSRLAFWFALLLILVYSRKIEKQPLMLWKEKQYPFWHYVASVLLTLLTVFAAVTMLSIIAMALQMKARSEGLEKMMAVFRDHHALVWLTAITAGITEELMLRAYLIPRLQLLFKNDYIPVIVSSVLFGFLHFGYGTALNIVGPMVIGLIFGFHYVKYRNIKVLIIVHFLWDYLLIALKIHFTPH